MHVHRPGGRLLVASDGGRGFLVEEDDALGQTRAGKAVLLPGEGDPAAACARSPTATTPSPSSAATAAC